MAVAAILDLFGWVMGPPTKPHSWCVPPVQILSWSAKYFSSYKDLNFFSFRLESPIHAPKISFLGGILPPEFSGTSFRPPKGSSLSGTTRFEPSLIQIWRTVRPVALAKKTKQKRQWQTGYSPRPPTLPYRSQSLHAGWPPVCSSIFKVLLKSVQWFCRSGWSKIALPHHFAWPLAYTTACTYTVQAVITYTHGLVCQVVTADPFIQIILR